MKSTFEITIDLPRQRVLDLIMDPANFPKWQPGVKTFKLLSGQQGQPGAKAKVVIESHGFKIEMTETIVERRLPDLYALRYEGKGVKNTVENRFYEDGPGRTRWVMVNTLEVGLMMAVAGPVINEVVTRQNHDSMKSFKAFAERT